MRPEVVVVSGASRGIGAATVRLLGAKGYRLALLARNGSEMQQLVKDAGLAQGQYLILEVDLTQSENLSSVIKQIVAHFERIDVLVNNAGMGKFGPMENISVKEMMELFQLNVFAGFALTQSVLPHFKAQNAGVFVNVLSDAGRRTFAGGTAYCATKFAQDGMFGSLQAELEGSNISVCNLYPGLVNTYFNNKQPQGPRPGVLEPKAVAEAIQMAIESPWEHPEIWLKAD